jgi:hypothetical protein
MVLALPPPVERGSVLGQLPVAFSDLARPVFVAVAARLVYGLGVDKRADGLAHAVRGELAGQPAVYLADDHSFADGVVAVAGENRGRSDTISAPRQDRFSHGY